MLYIKPNDSDMIYSVITLTPFKTCSGYDAIRIVSEIEIPTMINGFKFYQNEEELISDFSDYKYQYTKDSYSMIQDSNVSGVPSYTPLPTPYDSLSHRISVISSQVNDITPIIMSKNAYIDDTMVEFDYTTKQGNISAWLENGDVQVPCEFEVIENKIIVYFNALEEVSVVKVSIQ